MATNAYVESGQGARISLDCAGGDICYVSHAHSDHASAAKPRKKQLKLLATKETLRLAGSQSASEELPQGVSLHNAGHILGSTQILVESKNSRFVYTGDLKVQDSLTVQGASPVECDTLMIEGTYANPAIGFPERREVYSQMASWVENVERQGWIAVLGGYATGKAQEIVKLLNSYCKITPVVSPRIYEVCSAYTELGMKLDCVNSDSEKGQEIMEGAFVAVLPQNAVDCALAKKLAVAHDTVVKTAVATGWASIRKFDTDTAFALSDHADFSELVDFVKAAGAKKVLCTHGNEELFARELRKLGIEGHAYFAPQKLQNAIGYKGTAGGIDAQSTLFGWQNQLQEKQETQEMRENNPENKKPEEKAMQEIVAKN